MLRGVNHVEFIKRSSDGKFFMLEASARVGGAHIAEMVEAATGVNLWEEWANLEVDHARGQTYRLPATRQEYAGVALTLARQEQPDLSAYDDPEIVYRAPEKQHAGLVVRSREHARVQALLESYQERFARDFTATLPAKAESMPARGG
jgi:biotin carboxylase